jgi:phosphatidylinositol glycan class A protein
MLKIALISDFFYPNIGGVEAHIYSLAYCLRKLGHKVIVITREREDFNICGVRYYSNGIKTYYLPCLGMSANIIYPAIFSTLSLLVRSILIREKIQVLHGHQDSSIMVIASIPIATSLDIPFFLTQHSLHNFGDLASIELNNMYRVLLRHSISKLIAVSNTVKENYLLRCHCPSDQIVVIPNAIDHYFYKRQDDIHARKDPGIIKIIVLTRMTYRKGISLLLEILPIICKKYKQVRFLICGDGPMRSIAEKIARDYIIESQVEFVGFSDIEQVPKIHSSGDIFLNTSISEAFCLAILEAASCGLYVISTNVGGINEILPPGAISLCPPNAEGLIDAIIDAIDNKKYIHDPKKTIDVIKNSYDWNLVSMKTADLYEKTLREFRPKNKFVLLLEFLIADFKNWIFFMLVALTIVFGSICEFFWPPGEAVDLPSNFGISGTEKGIEPPHLV